MDVDVLCIGHASHDLIVEVDRHPGADEKAQATSYLSCGGGPAANAADGQMRLGAAAEAGLPALAAPARPPSAYALERDTTRAAEVAAAAALERAALVDEFEGLT